MEIKPETATLIAALIAAGASLYTVIATSRANRSVARENAHRVASAENLKALGKAVHETVALTDLLARARPERWKEKQELARRPARELKDLRLEVRYFVWGIDNGIRTLTRYPDWVSHTKDFPAVREKMVRAGRKLGRQIDLAVRDTLLSGNLPSLWRRASVKLAAVRLKNVQRSFVNSRRA